MIHVFNRTELAIAYSIREQNLIKGLLDSSHIEYVMTTNKIISMQSWSRGSLIDSGESTLEYKFFVKRSQYEEAIRILKDNMII